MSQGRVAVFIEASFGATELEVLEAMVKLDISLSNRGVRSLSSSSMTALVERRERVQISLPWSVAAGGRRMPLTLNFLREVLAGTVLRPVELQQTAKQPRVKPRRVMI